MFNAGGYVNHGLYFENLAPPKSANATFSPDSVLGKAITDSFGTLDQLKKAVNQTTAALQGSGWVWVGFDTHIQRLVVASTADQVTLTTMEPILAFDIWEHAYYLQYFNQRYEYLSQLWSVVNFHEAENRLIKARDKSN